MADAIVLLGQTGGLPYPGVSARLLLLADQPVGGPPCATDCDRWLNCGCSDAVISPHPAESGLAVERFSRPRQFRRICLGMDLATPQTHASRQKLLVFGEPANLPVGAADDDRMWPHILEPTVRSLPTDVFERLRKFSPSSTPVAKREAVAEFVRNAVSAVAPQNHFTVEQATAPLVHLVNWAHVTSGLPLRYASLLSPAPIEFFLDKALADGSLAPGTVRNYRAHLTRVASALGIAVAASPAPIRRDERARPYSVEELAQLRLWARTRPSSMSRARADSLLTLAAGAGLRTTELITVRARDIVLDDSDAWVCVQGDRARVVPVLPLWRNRIARRVQALQPDELLFPQPDETSTVRLNEWRKGQADAPQPQRLRASWLVQHLTDGTAAHHLLEWAGIDRGETLAGYLQFISHDVDEGRRRELIHARTDRSNRSAKSQMWDMPRIALSEGATSKRGRTAQ
ncbi:MAG: hypothetical protein K2X36_03650 [Microbacteriaceae bacterium]|nr:hypothetical protein [Microbacteriaceae bacterium]